MTKKYHYAPILRAKVGEIDALGHLSPRAKAGMLPMLDMPSIGEDERSSLPGRLCKTITHIKSTWGTENPVLLDMSLFSPSFQLDDGRHPVELMFEQARQCHLQAIPVTGPEVDRGPGFAYLDCISNIAAIGGRGVGIRIGFDEFQSDNLLLSAIDETLARLKVDPAKVDMYFDLGPIEKLKTRMASVPVLSESLQAALRSVRLMRFRNTILSGTSIPHSVGPKYNLNPCRVERIELSLWRQLTEWGGTSDLIFGDYGIMSPLQIDGGGGGRPPSRIRLSTASEHVLFRGNPDRYRQLRAKVFRSDAMNYQARSWGLAALLGHGSARLGTATDWVARDTNAHLETTFRDITKGDRSVVDISLPVSRRPRRVAWLQEGLDLPEPGPTTPPPH